MKLEQQNIRNAIKRALAVGAVSAIAAPSAFAADADQNQNAAANQSSTATLGKIEVTGSRIKRTDVETAQPVTIVTAAQIKATGLTAIGDVLQQMSSGGAAQNTQFNNGGDGETFLDLRNLGSKRVLVLVNGKRWISDVGGQVDTNTIPVAIVDHVEVLQDGASAIYGSDAISGVINIITVKDYNGAEANAYMGIFAGEGHHDGKQQAYDFTIGSSNDKGGVLVNVSYVNQAAVWAGNRAISAEPTIGAGQAGGSSGTPSGRFVIAPFAKINGNTPGVCPPNAHPTISASGSGSCDMTLINPGTQTPTLGNFRDGQFGSSFQVTPGVPTPPFGQGSNADRFNYAPANYLITPSERTALFVQGHYDLADNLTFTTEALANRRFAQLQLAPQPLFIGLAGTTFVNGTTPQISAQNPYNPFGVDLVNNAKDPCLKAGSCDLLVFSGRRPLELGNRIPNLWKDTFSFRAGLKGYFNMAGSEWDWDVGYMYGDSPETRITTGFLNDQNLQNALGLPGQAPCAGQSKTSGCVPFNWFGGYNTATGQGSITPAMAKYVLYEDHTLQGATTRNYTANITGDLADLPAGPLSLAGGFEYLENESFVHTDELDVTGNSSNGTAAPVDGVERTDAEYIEFSIPLVADAPFMKNVNLDIADRWSQFRWNGGEQGTATSVVHSTTNTSGRAALRWQATDSLLLRGSWSQGFRIPSVSEFFLGQQDSFPTVQDPCVVKVPKNPVRAVGCPTGVTNIQPNAQIRTTVGGNPALTPEKSIAETAGFVYNPDFFPGFDLSMDYYKLNVTNAVSAISPQTILQGCYGTPGGNPLYCNLIQRNNLPNSAFQGGSITDILDLNINIGGLLTEGVDLQAGYKFPSTSVGDFKANLSWTFVKEYVTTIPFGAAGTLSSQELSGTTLTAGGLPGTAAVTGGVPKQRANIDVGWNSGNWSGAWHVEYIGSMIEDCESVAVITPASRCPLTGNFPYAGRAVQENHIGATFYHDVSGTYHMDSVNTDFTFGIRNLFDKDPPVAMSAFANSFLPTYYRTPGRFFYARVGVKF